MLVLELRGLTTALDLVKFENDRRRRAKEEVEPVPEGPAVVRIRAAAPRLLGCGEQRRSAGDAEGHEQDAKQPGGHVLHNDLVVTKGTKQDLVEGGRRGDGSVHVDQVSGNRVYEERGGFSGAKYTTFARIEATQSAYGDNP